MITKSRETSSQHAAGLAIMVLHDDPTHGHIIYKIEEGLPGHYAVVETTGNGHSHSEDFLNGILYACEYFYAKLAK